MFNMYTAEKNLLVILLHSVVIDKRSYKKLYIGSFIERLHIKVMSRTMDADAVVNNNFKTYDLYKTSFLERIIL